jgi:hypothetical protein
MELKEVFKRFLNDEFKPAAVFASVNGEPRSLVLANLSDYDYAYAGVDLALDLPILE